jgi:hypothetical protein
MHQKTIRKERRHHPTITLHIIYNGKSKLRGASKTVNNITTTRDKRSKIQMIPSGIQHNLPVIPLSLQKMKQPRRSRASPESTHEYESSLHTTLPKE